MDKKCHFHNSGEGPCSEKQLDRERDFCHGCKTLICDAHSRNLELPFGSHEPEAHLEEPADAE